MCALECKIGLPEKENPAANPYILFRDREISCLEAMGERLTFPKNHVFIEAGQKTDYCYVVKNGRVFAFEVFANGEERIYHVHEKNSLFLECNLLFDQPTPVGFRADVAVEVIRIEKTSLRKAVIVDQTFSYDLLESASGKFFSAMEQISHGKSYNITWKICNLFLAFAAYYGKDCGNGKVVIAEKFSQQTIAAMLGINRITAVRAIKQLKDLGYLEKNKNQHYVIDVKKVQTYQNEKRQLF